MKGKLIVFMFLLFFGFSALSSFAQSTNNDQRIVGIWVNTTTEQGVNYTITLVFNANGSGIMTLAGGGQTDTENFSYGISASGEMMSDNGPRGKIYFSPDGRILFIDNDMPFRKR